MGIFKKFSSWLGTLVGNNRAATIGIFAFIAILCLCFVRCTAARADEVDVVGGASFGHSSGPVLGLNYYHPLPQLKGVEFYAGTMLWGGGLSKGGGANNWDWHTGLRACHGSFCASLGAVYLQDIDGLNGSHTNYNLSISYLFGNHRVSSIDVTHISNAGTTKSNIGRQAATVSIRLQ